MTMQDTLNQYITTELLTGQTIELDNDENLLLSGLIDSHGIVRLLTFIEQSFQIKVPPGDVTIQNFRSINAMSSYLETQRIRA